MKRILLIFAILASLLTASMSQVALVRADGIYFKDADSSTIVLGNNIFEIGLRKSNGSIAYITDKATGKQVSRGSRNECLWNAIPTAGRPAIVGGCSYDSTKANRFTYAWAADQNTLTMNYTPDPGSTQNATAQVQLIASNEAWFDLRLRLQNNLGTPIDDIAFPADLVFPESEMKAALLPSMPGVVLEPGFFVQKRSFLGKYPQGWGGFFADYVWLSTSNGQIAIYPVSEPGPIRTATMGFNHDDNYIKDSTYYVHNYGVRLASGGTWTSPRVRVRVSQSIPETAQAFRVDNGLDKFRSLRDKLGSRFTQMVQSPIYKADANQLKIPFAKYPDLFAKLPTPGILHAVSYQAGVVKVDASSPDYFPTNPAWGTPAEFAAMFKQAQLSGLLVMPYINPTWWEDQAPTLKNLPAPLTIKDIAVLNDRGDPLHIIDNNYGGYVVSPSAPFVKQRVDQLVQQMTTDVPSDLLFEDQIGARQWVYDSNPSSSSPTAYVDGWLDHTRNYSSKLLMTEFGFDRLAETEVGFNGSVLLHQLRGTTKDWWGTDTWHVYPLEPMLLRDKVLIYQHNLEQPPMTINKANLTWNIAFGYMLNYNLASGVDNLFLQVDGAFQKNVLSRYADENATNFVNLEDKVTQTTFKTVTVTANWKDKEPYAIGNYTLAPLGFVVTDTLGTLTAGVFSGFNGISLGGGDHFLIEERGQDDITIRQPLGASTSLSVRIPSGWRSLGSIQVSAFTSGGQFIANAPAIVTDLSVSFNYQPQVAGQTVAYYKIARIPPAATVSAVASDIATPASNPYPAESPAQPYPGERSSQPLLPCFAALLPAFMALMIFKRASL